MPALTREFYDRHHVDVATDMIGTHLHWDGVSGMIVETEAYAVCDDPACHTFFRPSAREFFDAGSPGVIYAYLSYGIHWMLNVLTRDGIVLIRALQPMTGICRIQQRRRTRNIRQLCSGPGKIGQALSIGPHDHGSSLLRADRFLQSRASDLDISGIATDIRVGLSVGLDRPWRFLLTSSPYVSVAQGKALSRSRTRMREQ